MKRWESMLTLGVLFGIAAEVESTQWISVVQAACSLVFSLAAFFLIARGGE